MVQLIKNTKERNNMKQFLKIKKQQTGAISTLVLFTILMFLVILMGVFFTVTTKQESQLKSDMRIQEIYKEQVNSIDEIYNELISN